MEKIIEIWESWKPCIDDLGLDATVLNAMEEYNQYRSLSEPIRIQLSRTKGFNLREAVDRFEDCLLNNAMVYRYFDDLDQAKIYFEHFKYISENIELLRGKNLACWCPLLDKNNYYVPCLADVLLKLANK